MRSGIYNDKVIGKTSLILLILINCLFFFKYSFKINDFLFILTPAFAIGLYYFYILIGSVKWFGKPSFIFTLLSIYTCILVIALTAIDKEKVVVDRWDAIINWWDFLLAGKYPYAATTRMQGFPSPLPFLQLVFFPFYLLGELGWAPLAFIWLFLLALKLLLKWPWRNISLSVLLFLISPAIAWEICVRSTLFVNTVLFSFLLFYIVYKANFSKTELICMGLISGFLISSRMVFMLVIIIITLNIFRKLDNKSTIAYYILPFIICFLITIVPLFAWGLMPFLERNPFLSQSGHMPNILSVALLFIALAMGYFIVSPRELIFSVAVLLFLNAAIFVIKGLINVHNYGYSIDEMVDISYFILSMPFFVLSIPNIAKQKHAY